MLWFRYELACVKPVLKHRILYFDPFWGRKRCSRNKKWTCVKWKFFPDIGNFCECMCVEPFLEFWFSIWACVKLVLKHIHLYFWAFFKVRKRCSKRKKWTCVKWKFFPTSYKTSFTANSFLLEDTYTWICASMVLKVKKLVHLAHILAGVFGGRKRCSQRKKWICVKWKFFPTSCKTSPFTANGFLLVDTYTWICQPGFKSWKLGPSGPYFGRGVWGP